MNIGCIIAGFIILSNPNVGIIDIFPDVFGFLLIIHGIGVSKLFSPQLTDTFCYSVILSVLSVIKTLCTPLVFQNIRSLPIVLSFSFGIIECIFLILFAGKFFEGLFYLGVRYDIPSVFNGGKEIITTVAGKSKADKGVLIKRITCGFFLIRSVLSVIPDLSDLQLETDGSSGPLFSSFSNLIIISTISLGLIIAAVFLGKLIPYLHFVSKDRSKVIFDEKCAAVSDDPLFQDTLHSRRVIVLLAFSAVLSIFISVDGIIIPAAIPAVFVCITAFMMLNYNKRSFLVFIPAIISAVASVFDIIFRYKFFVDMNNAPEASLWSPASGGVYDRIVVFNCIERISLTLSLMLLLYCFYKKTKSDLDDMSQRSDYDTFDKEKSASFQKKFLIWITIGAPIYILTAFEPLLTLEIDIISVVLTVIGFIWILLLLLQLIDAFRMFYRIEKE